MSKSKNVKIVKVALIKDMSKLAKLIDSIKGRGARLQHDIHRAALGCLLQLLKHGNIIPARQLLDAVPAMGRKNALLAWFETFGPCYYDKVDKQLVYDKDKRVPKEKDQLARIADGMNAPFWEFRPEPEYQQLDLLQSIEKLIERAEKALKREEQDKKKIPAQKLQQLRLIVNE